MERICQTSEFSQVYRRGKSKADRNLVVYMLKHTKGSIRLGVSVSKKVGNSVVRHRIKRRIKEAARLHEDMLPASADLVVIARAHAAEADYHELEHSLILLTGKLLSND